MGIRTWPITFTMLGVCALIGCSTLDPTADAPWHPYSPGDTLVFASTEGSMDTRVIAERSQHDQLDQHRPEHLEEVRCLDLCSLRPGETGSTFIVAKTTPVLGSDVLSFNLSCGHAATYGYTGTFRSALDSLPLRTLSVEGRTLTDVVAILPDTASAEYKEHVADNRTVARIFWSRSLGLVRYDMLTTGVVWTLSRSYTVAR